MSITHVEEYRDPVIAQSLVHQLKSVSTRTIRLMEVCGTHTMAIFRHGIRALLPETIALLSGPGCPVCVTAQGEIDAFVALSRRQDVTVTTFGDLMRVPGSGSSLQRESAEGADVRMVYSPMDAIQLACSATGTVLWALRMEKFLSFIFWAVRMAAAMVGAVVSNPTPRNTTSRSGRSEANCMASMGE